MTSSDHRALPLAKEPADRPASAEVAYALGIAFAEVPLMRPVPEQTQLAPISVSPGGPPRGSHGAAQGAHSRPRALHAGGALGLATIGHTVWAVQTDAENVKRLAAEVPEVHFFALDPADVTLSPHSAKWSPSTSCCGREASSGTSPALSA